MFKTNVYMQYPYTSDDNILIVLLVICSSKQDQVPWNTFILFFPHHFLLLGIYWNGNQVGRHSCVGGV
jgi:hypothetical protein